MFIINNVILLFCLSFINCLSLSRYNLRFRHCRVDRVNKSLSYVPNLIPFGKTTLIYPENHFKEVKYVDCSNGRSIHDDIIQIPYNQIQIAVYEGSDALKAMLDELKPLIDEGCNLIYQKYKAKAIEIGYESGKDILRSIKCLIYWIGSRLLYTAKYSRDRYELKNDPTSDICINERNKCEELIRTFVNERLMYWYGMIKAGSTKDINIKYPNDHSIPEDYVSGIWTYLNKYAFNNLLPEFWEMKFHWITYDNATHANIINEHIYNNTSPPEVQSYSSSTTTSLHPAVSYPNYLPVNGDATPRDRGGEKVVIGPQVEPAADLREAKGEVNKESHHGEWNTTGGNEGILEETDVRFVSSIPHVLGNDRRVLFENELFGYIMDDYIYYPSIVYLNELKLMPSALGNTIFRSMIKLFCDLYSNSFEKLDYCNVIINAYKFIESNDTQNIINFTTLQKPINHIVNNNNHIITTYNAKYKSYDEDMCNELDIVPYVSNIIDIGVLMEIFGKDDFIEIYNKSFNNDNKFDIEKISMIDLWYNNNDNKINIPLIELKRLLIMGDLNGFSDIISNGINKLLKLKPIELNFIMNSIIKICKKLMNNLRSLDLYHLNYNIKRLNIPNNNNINIQQLNTIIIQSILLINKVIQKILQNNGLYTLSNEFLRQSPLLYLIQSFKTKQYNTFMPKPLKLYTNTSTSNTPLEVQSYSSPPEVQSYSSSTSTFLGPAVSSPPEVTTTVPLAVEASSNYLSLKGRTTPRDRGEGSDASVVSTGPRVEPGSDLRELEGEVNREADGRTGPQVESCLQDKERTSGIINSTSCDDLPSIDDEIINDLCIMEESQLPVRFPDEYMNMNVNSDDELALRYVVNYYNYNFFGGRLPIDISIKFIIMDDDILSSNNIIDDNINNPIIYINILIKDSKLLISRLILDECIKIYNKWCNLYNLPNNEYNNGVNKLYNLPNNENQNGVNKLNNLPNNYNKSGVQDYKCINDIIDIDLEYKLKCHILNCIEQNDNWLFYFDNLYNLSLPHNNELILKYNININNNLSLIFKQLLNYNLNYINILEILIKKININELWGNNILPIRNFINLLQSGLFELSYNIIYNKYSIKSICNLNILQLNLLENKFKSYLNLLFNNNLQQNLLIYIEGNKIIECAFDELRDEIIKNKLISSSDLTSGIKSITNHLQQIIHNYDFNHIYNLQSNPSEVQSTSPPEVTTSVPLAESSPLEVNPAVSSSNYLSLKSKATPGDRGNDEGGEDITSSGSVIPGSDLRELEGEVNKEGHHGEWIETTPDGMNNCEVMGDSGDKKHYNYNLPHELDNKPHDIPHVSSNGTEDVTSSVMNNSTRPRVEPAADLREAKGELNREGSLQEEDKVVTSSGKTSDGVERTSCDDDIMMGDVEYRIVNLGNMRVGDSICVDDLYSMDNYYDRIDFVYNAYRYYNKKLFNEILPYNIEIKFIKNLNELSKLDNINLDFSSPHILINDGVTDELLLKQQLIIQLCNLSYYYINHNIEYELYNYFNIKYNSCFKIIHFNKKNYFNEKLNPIKYENILNDNNYNKNYIKLLQKSTDFLNNIKQIDIDQFIYDVLNCRDKIHHNYNNKHHKYNTNIYEDYYTLKTFIIHYLNWKKFKENNTYYNTISNNLPNVQSTSPSLAESSSPPEVTTTVPLGVEPSSNYLSLKSRATPGDRGRSVVNGPQVEPGSDLRELEGEVNREADGRNVTSSGEGATPSGKTSNGSEDGLDMGLSYDNSSIGIDDLYGVFHPRLLYELWLRDKLIDIDNKMKKMGMDIPSLYLLPDNWYEYLTSNQQEIVLDYIANKSNDKDNIFTILTKSNAFNQTDAINVITKIINHSNPSTTKSPPEVTTTVPLAVPPEVLPSASSNSLPVNGNATPGDRGEVEGSDASAVKNSDWTSSGLPVADLREAEGEVNKGSCLQDEDKVVTSGGDNVDMMEVDEFDKELRRVFMGMDESGINEVQLLIEKLLNGYFIEARNVINSNPNKNFIVEQSVKILTIMNKYSLIDNHTLHNILKHI